MLEQERRGLDRPPTKCTSRRCGARSQRRQPRDYVLPGNKEYHRGRFEIARPPSGGAAVPAGHHSGEGEDEFRFALSRRGISSIMYPRGPGAAGARQEASSTSGEAQCNGARPAIPPAAARRRMSDRPRTLRHSMSRRIALKRPRRTKIVLKMRGGDRPARSAARRPLRRARQAARASRRAARTPHASCITYVDPSRLCAIAGFEADAEADQPRR
jgi:uncharacterized sporulation protein YeaH/YhbH (DUF444 family)